MAALAEAPGHPNKPDRTKKRSTRVGLVLLAVIMVTFTIGVAAVLVNVQAFRIPSPSMQPTLKVGDRVLLDKLAYRRHAVHRGDIVIFDRAANEAGAIRSLVKRVLAVGGDTIESRDDQMLVNGQPVDEPYVTGPHVTSPVARTTVPARQAFVVGDNRTNSRDSRVDGPIDQDRILGRVFLRYWPSGAAGRL